MFFYDIPHDSFIQIGTQVYADFYLYMFSLRIIYVSCCKRAGFKIHCH